MILEHLLHFSVPQFTHVQNREGENCYSVFPIRSFCGLKESAHASYLKYLDMVNTVVISIIDLRHYWSDSLIQCITLNSIFVWGTISDLKVTVLYSSSDFRRIHGGKHQITQNFRTFSPFYTANLILKKSYELAIRQNTWRIYCQLCFNIEQHLVEQWLF